MTFLVDLPGLDLKSENWWRQMHPGWLLAKQRNTEKQVVGTRLMLGMVPRLAAAQWALVTLTRRSKSTRGLDSDGLQGSFKYTRDTIAKRLGVDDGSLRLQWAYKQERGAPGASIVIEVREAVAA